MSLKRHLSWNCSLIYRWILSQGVRIKYKISTSWHSQEVADTSGVSGAHFHEIVPAGPRNKHLGPISWPKGWSVDHVTSDSCFWLLRFFGRFRGLVFDLLVSHDHLGASLRETLCILNQLRTVLPILQKVTLPMNVQEALRWILEGCLMVHLTWFWTFGYSSMPGNPYRAQTTHIPAYTGS